MRSFPVMLQLQERGDKTNLFWNEDVIVDVFVKKPAYFYNFDSCPYQNIICTVSTIGNRDLKLFLVILLTFYSSRFFGNESTMSTSNIYFAFYAFS